MNTKKCSTTEPTTKSANALQGYEHEDHTKKYRDQSTHLSGDTSLNRARFATLTWERNDAVSTNCPTVLANLSHPTQFRAIPAAGRKGNQSHDEIEGTQKKKARGKDAHPARKALKGKLVTSTQYTNWATPDRMRKTRKASMNFRREDVASRYAVQRVCNATADADAGAEGGVAGWAADAAGEALGLEAGVVEVAVEACFGVLGPAIMPVFPSQLERDVQCNMGGSLLRCIDRWFKPTCPIRFRYKGCPGSHKHCSPGSQYLRVWDGRVFPFPCHSQQRETFQVRHHHHAPCRTQPRNSRLHKNNKRGTTSRAFSAQR